MTLQEIALVAQIVGFVGIFFTVFFGFFRYKQYLIWNQKYNFDTIHKCNNRVERILIEFARIGELKNTDMIEYRFKMLTFIYVEICEEELYYIRKQMVPQEISIIWIDKIKEFLLGNFPVKIDDQTLLVIDNYLEEYLSENTYVKRLIQMAREGKSNEQILQQLLTYDKEENPKRSETAEFFRGMLYPSKSRNQLEQELS